MREHVVIIGSGMMGSGIGAMSALAGNKTILVDVEESRVLAGKERAVSCIRLRQEQGLNTAEEARRAETLLETSTDTEQAAESARMVIEAIVENLQAKQQLFEKLDRIFRQTCQFAAIPADLGLLISAVFVSTWNVPLPPTSGFRPIWFPWWKW